MTQREFELYARKIHSVRTDKNDIMIIYAFYGANDIEGYRDELDSLDEEDGDFRNFIKFSKRNRLKMFAFSTEEEIQDAINGIVGEEKLLIPYEVVSKFEEFYSMSISEVGD